MMDPRVIKRIFVVLLLVAVAGLGVFWWLTIPARVLASALPAHTPDLSNGQTVFNASGCASCHATPAQPDRLKLGGGLPIASPFGTFYVPNISPDATAGIGRWSEADFVTALQKGTSPSGAHYFPAFPYTSYQHMKLDDARDLFGFIKTLPQVAASSPEHNVPFPFNLRRNLGIWKLLFLDGAPFVADAGKSGQWNRGSYLVNALGHCAECHSPRNALGGIIEKQRFAGGPDAEGAGWVPNITQKGLGEWSERDLSYLLETGQTPEGDTVGGSMARVIRNTSQLSAEDRTAMEVYLKSLPAVDGPVKPPRK
jgi:mono/diheme cytochrome c family protein